MDEVVVDAEEVGRVSFDVGEEMGASTFSPMSSASSSSSSSAYCERLRSAFDGFSGVGFDTASIFLFRRSACGSRVGVAECVGFDTGGMNGCFCFSSALDSVSETFLFLSVMPLSVTG